MSPTLQASVPSPALAFIGCGAMGGSILRGLLKAGLVDPRLVVAADPDPGRLREFADQGVLVVGDGSEAARVLRPGGALVLAVKPQSFPDLAPRLKAAGGPLAISVMAGMTSERIAAALGGARVVRTMPNLGVTVGRGVTGIAAGCGSTHEDCDLARKLFTPLGTVIDLQEDQLDALTAVAGSGPAYVFLLGESMQKAAESLGLTPEQAAMAVRGTLIGAGELLARSDEPLASWRTRVTSKGGTTEAALSVLAARGFDSLLLEALTAARDRGRTLASMG